MMDQGDGAVTAVSLMRGIASRKLVTFEVTWESITAANVFRKLRSLTCCPSSRRYQRFRLEEFGLMSEELNTTRCVELLQHAKKGNVSIVSYDFHSNLSAVIGLDVDEGPGTTCVRKPGSGKPTVRLAISH